MVGFSGILCTGQVEDWKMMKEKLIDGKKLVKMIKDAGGKYDDYLIYAKIRQILLHWDYELTEKDILINWTINA